MTQTDIVAMVRAYNAGQSPGVIAQEQKVCPRKVRRLLKKAGVYRGRQQRASFEVTPEEVEQLRGGLRVADLAERRGVGINAVYKAIGRAGYSAAELTGRGKPLAQDVVDEFLKGTKPCKQIAKECGLSSAAFHAKIARQGIGRRPSLVDRGLARGSWTQSLIKRGLGRLQCELTHEELDAFRELAEAAGLSMPKYLARLVREQLRSATPCSASNVAI